jgi:hypothetical protein
MSIEDGELTDIAWIDDSLETITVAMDRVAVTFSIDEFFQLRKDMDTIAKIITESPDVQLCTYEDDEKVTRYLLLRRAGTDEVH